MSHDVFHLDPDRDSLPDPVLSTDLLEFVADRYRVGMGEPRDLGGDFNLNVRLDRHVVRVYGPWVSAARVDEIQRVRRTVAAAGVPIPELVPAVDGATWCQYGEYVLEVENFVPGERMDGLERLSVGMRTLGRLHALMVDVDIDVPPAIANHLPQELAVGATADAVALIRSWGPTKQESRYAEIAEELASLLPIFDLPSQLVHGDFWDNNVLFHDGVVVAVLDFDFAGVRPRVDDLALSLGYPLQAGRSVAEVRTLVDAYDAGCVVPLSTEERRALPFAMARMALFFLQYLRLPGDAAYERMIRQEFTEKRGPACEWWLHAIRNGTLSEHCFT